MSDQNGKIELWFFRDLVDAQRMKLFSILGFPADELGTLGRQKLAINAILTAKDLHLQAENDQLLQRIQNLQDRITWHRDGFREMSKWSPEVAAERTKQFALDTLTGPTSEALAQVRAAKEAAALAAVEAKP